MENIFFNLDYSSLSEMLEKVGVFIFLSVALIWVFYLLFSRILFRKSRLRKELSIRLSYLWAVFTYFLLFNIYIAVLIYLNGLDSLHFLQVRFCLGIMAQTVTYLGLVILFLVKRHSLKKIINDNSLK